MRFDLEGLEVFFPYDRIYLEQYQYMRSLKHALDSSSGGHALLESPTGCGKTVCLLSLICSYQYAHPKTGKLIYCTRTVPEMNHVMEELGVVLEYRAEQLGLSSRQPMETNYNTDAANSHTASMDIEDSGAWSENASQDGKNEEASDSIHMAKKQKKIFTRKVQQSEKKNLGPLWNNGYGAGGSGVVALCLSSRRNMCIHDRVIQESDREAVDAACRSMTASWVIEKASQPGSNIETCSFYNSLRSAGESISMPSGIYDLEELKNFGKKRYVVNT